MNKDGYREVLSAAEGKAEHGQRQARQGATGHGIRYVEHIDGPKGLRIRWHRRPQLWRAFRFDVFCEPGLGIKINGRPWDRPFCIRNRKPPNSGGAF